MTRPALVLLLLIADLALVFGLRTWLHRRRTGSAGFRGGPLATSLPFGLALAGTLAAPLLAFGPDPAPSTPLAPGLALVVLGTALVVWSQATMGASWRIGVDERERTALVTRGPFALVRNPIFTGMLVTGAGLVALLPNITALASLALLLLALELQVRRIEEPYLLRTHGRAYRDYARRTGRFLPLLGVLQQVPCTEEQGTTDPTSGSRTLPPGTTVPGSSQGTATDARRVRATTPRRTTASSSATSGSARAS